MLGEIDNAHDTQAYTCRLSLFRDYGLYMRTIGFVLKVGAPEAERAATELAAFLHEAGRTVLVENSQEALACDCHATVSHDLAVESDLLVVLGGDGTILRAASLLRDKPTPVMGVNLGRVGFLAEILPDHAIPAMQQVLDGTATYVNRMMLEAQLPDGRRVCALNELVIHWGAIARLMELDIRVGSSSAIELRADGLIVCTPVGSSAYSYAAYGPLAHPEVEGVILTPICPYAGLKRPLLIPAHLPIEIILRKGEDLTLTVDGHTRWALCPGQSIRITRAALPFVMVKSPGRDYFDVLKHKLGLTQDERPM